MAERTGYTAAELAAMRLYCLSAAANKVRARAEREGWPFSEQPVRGARGTQRVFALATLPEVIRTAITEQVTTASSAPPVVEAKPEHASIAHERYRIVAGIAELVARGERVGAALEAMRGEHPARTVRRWYDSVREEPRIEWMTRLVPGWRGPTDLDDVHEDAFAFFRDDYLRGSKPAAAECHRRMLDVAKVEGWAPIPGVAALMRRLKRKVSATTIILKREGELAIERSYPAQERDKTGMLANDTWNADGHRLDVMVRWPDGVIERPILVGYQDVACSLFLSWRVDRTENSDLIRLAFADAAVQHGAPRTVSFDNGLAFASKQNTGGCHWRFRGKVNPEEPVGVITQLVEEVRWVLPHHGQSKPIERAWRDLCETISRHAVFEGAYVGSNPTKKPHNFDASNAVDLELFLQVVGAMIARHNERNGRRSPMARGRSFAATYAESYAAIPVDQRRLLRPEQQRILWLASDRVRLSAPDGALRVHGNRYWTQELTAHIGKDAVARFDPDALHTGVHIYLASGSYVGWAECIEKTGYADRQASRNHAQARAAHSKAAKTIAAIETRHSPAEIAARHLSALGIVAPPPASVIRPNFAAPRLSKAAVIVAEESTDRQRRQREDADEVAELFSGSFDKLVANDD